MSALQIPSQKRNLAAHPMLCGSWGVVGQATAGASSPCACRGDTAYAAVLGWFEPGAVEPGGAVEPQR